MTIRDIIRYGRVQFRVTLVDKPCCAHERIAPVRLSFRTGLNLQSFGLTLREATEIADALRDAVTATSKPKTENEQTQQTRE